MSGVFNDCLDLLGKLSNYSNRKYGNVKFEKMFNSNQVWLEEKLGKSFNTVNGYVQNRSQRSLEMLYVIAKVLNLEPKELLAKVANKLYEK